jgi:cyanophycinase
VYLSLIFLIPTVMKLKKLISIVFLFSLLILSYQCQHDESKAITTGPENGHLVVVGGSLTDPGIYAKFLELAGGPDANIVIVPTAGSDEYLFEEGGWDDIEKRFRLNGIENITFLHTRNPEEANTEEFVRPIEKASGLWFTGGRQWRLVDSYLNTLTHKEILNLLDRGGVVGGSSAGASIQGSFLVRGDTKTNVIMMGDHQEGLSLISNCAIDQHLLALNRQFDIFEILEAHPELLGIGLDENTAIVVNGDEFEVIGQSYVVIYDGTVCNFVRDKADWLIERPEIKSLPEGSERFYLLGPGRKYSLAERRVIQ